MKLNATTGAALAAAAAILVANVTVPAAAGSTSYKVKCFGLNACKGHGSCKSAGNACKGHNACKGKGYSMISKSRCLAKGGSTTRG